MKCYCFFFLRMDVFIVLTNSNRSVLLFFSRFSDSAQSLTLEPRTEPYDPSIASPILQLITVNAFGWYFLSNISVSVLRTSSNYKRRPKRRPYRTRLLRHTSGRRIRNVRGSRRINCVAQPPTRQSFDVRLVRRTRIFGPLRRFRRNDL